MSNISQTHTDAAKAIRARVLAVAGVPAFLPNETQEKPASFILVTPSFDRGTITGFSNRGIKEKSHGSIRLEIAVPKYAGLGATTTIIDRLEPAFTCAIDGDLRYLETDTDYTGEYTETHFVTPFFVYFSWIRHKGV